ncbi:hypothetical protein [Amycolatopsis viridis]|uniref:Uncharacterized protein n=1 Tax=Amycolatopsis viridis TaxID=185678 RepID=A0ABX0STT5_9PSEU|nr:hypothetical protein [Amycolatopsis viridis]NIH80356.1 hypothetical protein [Amycolatopsis viridis]
MEQTCEELAEAGFLIKRLREPRPTPDAAALDPERYARLTREPTGFLAICAVPGPRGAPSSWRSRAACAAPPARPRPRARTATA